MTKMMIEVYQCEICKEPIRGVMVGMGSGDGDSFAHRECLMQKERENVVLKLCREWYQNGKDVTKQSLWYHIGVMIENE